MLILGINSGGHDACACLFDDYRMLAAVALERVTRKKSHGGRVPVEAIDECLAIAGRARRDIDAVVMARGMFPTHLFRHFPPGRALAFGLRRWLGDEKHKYMENECVRYRRTDSVAMFDGVRFKRELGLRADATIAFANHHLAHALPCLFHSSWPEALLYTADGGGDNVQYSMRLFRDGRLTELYGGEAELTRPRRVDSLGQVYAYATEALGFIPFRHEGKVTGLAALGKPKLYDALARHFSVDAAGEVHSDFPSYRAMRQCIFDLAQGNAREDVSASVQLLLENVILESVGRILKRHPMRYLGLAGGVFANVRLNQRLAEELPLDEVFVYPAMSDQGLAAGAVLEFLLARDGMKRWLDRRWPLENLYYGRDFAGAIDTAFEGDPRFQRVSASPVRGAAGLLQQGRIVAIYTGGMEYGPRALGARSIMAAALDADINRTLNDRLSRSEFMPFAPVVSAEDAESIFDLGPVKRRAARFMTITCGVRDAWRARIPAVVHVDGTARPQVIERADNPLYYDILASYKALSGVPVLINTSFNVHEEPIINTPAECARALAEGRVDFVVTDSGVYGRKAAAEEGKLVAFDPAIKSISPREDKHRRGAA
jgi:carbamoyltransferase